jgi:hypothetical protein
MNAHDVRHLAVCEVCGDLCDERGMLHTFGDLCPSCAVTRAGGIYGVIAMYPKREWGKLTLEATGVDGMRALLKAIKETP